MRLYVKLIDEERPEWWKSVPSEADLAREDAEVEARSARSPLKPRGNKSSHHRAWLAPPSRLGSILSEYPAGLAALAPGRWATPGHRHGGGDSRFGSRFGVAAGAVPTRRVRRRDEDVHRRRIPRISIPRRRARA